MSSPVLSLICCSRNDDYLGAALWRLQTGLNLTARAIHELGLENKIEIILTDWGSDAPIRDELCLTPEAAGLLSVLDVPRAVAERYQRDAPFSEVHALNAAARRSQGEYIGRIDQDTILGRRFLRTFFELYQAGSVAGVPLSRAAMLSNRRSVPYRFASRRPSPRVVEQFLRMTGSRLPLAMPLPDERYFQSYVGIWLIHRDLWFAIGGYDESFIYINWMEADMILRLQPHYPFVNLGRVVDHAIYHLDHMHPFAHLGARGRVRRENPVRSREHPPPVTAPNGPDWGLAGENLTLRPYVLKPGEADAARSAFRGAQWGGVAYHSAAFAARFALDKAIFALLRIGLAVPRLIIRLVPSLREPKDAYRDAVRGHPLGQWPRRLREEHRRRTARRRRADGRTG